MAFAAVLLACCFVPPALAEDRVLRQKGAGEVLFVGRSLGLPVASGRFEQIECMVDVDLTKPERSRIAVKIATGSLRGTIGLVDGFVKGPDILDVAHYPQMSFVSQTVQRIDDNNYRIDGLLTIKAVSRPVSVAVAIEGDVMAPGGGKVFPFTAQTSVSRADFGIGPGMSFVDDRLEIAVRGSIS